MGTSVATMTFAAHAGGHGTAPILASSPGGTVYATTNGRTNYAAMLNGTGTAGDVLVFPHTTAATLWLELGTATPSIPSDAQIRGLQFVLESGYLNVGSGAGDPTPAKLQFAWSYKDPTAPYPFGSETWQSPVQIGTVGVHVTNTGTTYTSSAHFDLEGHVSFPALQASDFANFVASISHVATGGATAEIRVYNGHFNVLYNQAPTAVVSITSGSTAPSTSPTVQWDYADAEGDGQDLYRVRIYKQSDTGALNTADWSGATPVYDSGEQSGSSTQWMIPGGYLTNFGTYRAFVSVADIGSSGRYNTVTNAGTGASNEGIDFVVNSDPYLMPALEVGGAVVDPILAAVTNIQVRQRINGLTIADASMESGGAASTGSWVLDAASNGTTPSIAANASAKFRGSYGLQLISGATTGSLVGALTGSYTAPPVGMLVMATIKVKNNGATRRQGTFAIYWNGQGAVDANSRPLKSVTTQWTSANFCTWTIITRVPFGATTYKLGFQITCGAAETFYADCAGLIVGCSNVLDDASFDSGGDAFWTLTNTGAGTSGYFNTSFATTPTQETTGLANTVPNGSGAVVSTFGASYESSAFNMALNPATGTARVDTAADVALMNTAFMLSGDVFGTSTAALPGTDVMALALDDGSFLPAGAPTTATAVTHASTYQNTALGRFHVRADSIATASARHGTFRFKTDGSTAFGVDNMAIEKLSLFMDGGFETLGVKVGNGGFFPAAVQTSFGEQDLTGYGHWARWSGGLLAPTISTTTPHTGTYCAVVASPATGTPLVPVAAGMEQWFTVAGWTSMVIDFWYKFAAATGATGYQQIDFLDSAGLLISSTTPFTTTASQGNWTHITNASVVVPTNACYVRLIFAASSTSAAGTLQVDDVTVTATGPGGAQAYNSTYAVGASNSFRASLPYLDGGWCGGGIVQSNRSTNFLLTYLQRSGTAFVAPVTVLGFTGVRSLGQTPIVGTSPGSDATLLAAISAYDVTFTDFEYPEVDHTSGATQQILYRAWGVYPVSATANIATPISTFGIVSGSVFTPTEWNLSDPLTATTVQLQVKKVRFQTDESLQMYTGMGRNRRIIVGDTVLGDTITLDLQSITHPQYRSLQALINEQATLVLRNPDGEMWYVRATKRQRERVWTGSYVDRPYRTYSITFEEVDALA